MGVGNLNGWNDEKLISKELSQAISVFYWVFSASNVLIDHQVSEQCSLRLEKEHIFYRNLKKKKELI